VDRVKLRIAVTSRSQIDKLGERLKAGPTTEADLRLLDEYRLTFVTAYQVVIDQIVALGLRPTGRPAKSTKAIVDKLQRESFRLSQIQDIAGCRVIVESIAEQDRVVVELGRVMPRCTVLDRRARPSHGYRAVHVVVEAAGQPVEVQIRTILQQVWAQISEKLADGVDPALKYGGGPVEIRKALEAFSDAISRFHDAGGARTMNVDWMSTLVEALQSIDQRPRAED
jgi:putative GTP pyrophosphokinase